MREYKRFTIKNSDGTYSQPTDLTFEKTFYRLAELEDKIERGELFSIPFMYHNKKLNAYTVVYEDDDYEYLMGQVFRCKNAKEEAEKFLEQKLKELLEVQNG